MKHEPDHPDWVAYEGEPALVLDTVVTTIHDRFRVKADGASLKIWITERHLEGAFTRLQVDDVVRLSAFLQAWLETRERGQ